MFGGCCSGETASSSNVEERPITTDAGHEEEACIQVEKLSMDSDEYYIVMIVGARGIRNSDWLPGKGNSDCYCEVRALGEGATEEPLYVTSILDDTLEPMWCELTALTEYKKKQGLQFKVWDKDYLGKVELQAGHFNKEGFNGELPLEGAGDGIRAYLRFKIKPPKMPYPSAVSPKFDVEVQRNSKEESWGLVLECQDGNNLYISGIAEGPFKKYNDGQGNEDLQVIVTDFIQGVNGNTTNMVDELNATEKATVTIMRAVDLTLIVEKGEGSLLSEFERKDVSDDGLVIKTLGEKGMFKAYNDQTPDAVLKLQVNDRIVRINGKAGNNMELHRMIEHAQGKFQVSVVRPAPDDEGKRWSKTTSANRWSFYD